MLFKEFMSFINRIKADSRVSFIGWVLFFYIALMALYLFGMNSGAQASDFIYDQF